MLSCSASVRSKRRRWRGRKTHHKVAIQRDSSRAELPHDIGAVSHTGPNKRPSAILQHRVDGDRGLNADERTNSARNTSSGIPNSIEHVLMQQWYQYLSYCLVISWIRENLGDDVDVTTEARRHQVFSNLYGKVQF